VEHSNLARGLPCDKAVAIVLNGDVELLADGKAKIASQSNGATQYVVCNGTCECKDFPKAPSGWCKHRIAAGMQKRATALMQKKLSAGTNGQAKAPRPSAQAEAPMAPLPEAPVSITLKATLHGHEVLVTLRGVDFFSVKAQVEQASQWLSVQAPALPPTQPPAQGMTQPANEDSPFCRVHNAVLKRYERNGQVWYSHKLTNGQWCCGR
jgi:hypothetical protein